MTRKTAHCPACGSEEICNPNVSAYWDESAQRFELSDFGAGRDWLCQVCENEFRQDDILFLPDSADAYTVIGISEGGEPDPWTFKATSAKQAAGFYDHASPSGSLHGVYLGDIGFRVDLKKE